MNAPLRKGDQLRRRLRRMGSEVARSAVATALAGNALRMVWTRPYEALTALGRAELLNTRASEAIARVASRMLDSAVRRTRGDWRAAVGASNEGADIERHFAARGGQWDLLHANVIVLKSPVGARERGVLLIKYSEILNAFPILFNLPEVQRRYHLVLEPSTTAYVQPSTRLVNPRHSIVAVQSIEPVSKAAYNALGFLAVDVSDGDWVDEAVFRIRLDVEKRYDAIMIANFIPVKRHEFLFRALRDHGHGAVRLALVASSHVGFGPEWARHQLELYGLSETTDIFLDISQERCNELLNASSCHVLCSLREGANRACLEALFAGVPVLLDARHIGFPHWRFGAPLVHTFTDEESLAAGIHRLQHELDRSLISSTAAATAGARLSTAKLEMALHEEALRRGESWTVGLTPKVTRVHCCYRNAADFERHVADYAFLRTATSSGFAYDPERARVLLTR